MDKDFIAAALDYHRSPTRGKISVVPTKGLTNQRDLALAYSPGVAAACDAIVADPADAWNAFARPRFSGGNNSIIATDVTPPKPPWVKPSSERIASKATSDVIVPVKPENNPHATMMNANARRTPR